MSFNRSGYIGRAPGDSAVTIAKQYFQPTSIGKTFTFSAGYSPGLIDVYRNGVKLVNVLDYAATDGSTIVLDTPVGVGSTVQVVAYKAFNLATVKATELDTTVTGTNLNLTGTLDVSSLATIVDLNVSGAATVSGTLAVGTGVTVYGNSGIVSATEFYGDGSNLDGVVSGVDVQLNGTTVGTSVTTLNFGAGISSVTPVSSGISTIETTRTMVIGVRVGTAVTFSVTGGSFNVSARSGNVSIDV
jgi:hypothetical protein